MAKPLSGLHATLRCFVYIPSPSMYPATPPPWAAARTAREARSSAVRQVLEDVHAGIFDTDVAGIGDSDATSKTILGLSLTHRSSDANGTGN